MNDDRRSKSATGASATLERPSHARSENAEGIPLDAISRRAYELYAASGYQHGRDVEHWLEAERQLKKDPRYR